MTTTQTPRSLQDLTTDVTAFPSWAALEGAMSKGYAPTLRPDTSSRSKVQRVWNEGVIELRTRLTQMGYKVYPEVL